MSNPNNTPISLKGKDAIQFEKYRNRKRTPEEIAYMKKSEEFYLKNSKPVKHQAKCTDCNFKFYLEDGILCIHQLTLGVGSFECPQCHSCICHGESVDQIKHRFKSKFDDGKLIKSPVNTPWAFQCVTVKKVTLDTEKPNTSK